MPKSNGRPLQDPDHAKVDVQNERHQWETIALKMLVLRPSKIPINRPIQVVQQANQYMNEILQHYRMVHNVDRGFVRQAGIP